MSFKITILGSGSAVPLEKRSPTSQYIICQNRHFLMDCGEGTQIQMRKNGVKFQKINHIFISHLHGDHFFGLVGLLSTMHLLGRDKNLHVYSPKGLKEVVELQYKLGGGKLSFGITWFEMEANFKGIVFEDKKVLVRTFPLKHRIPTQGYVFEEKTKERSLIKEKFDDATLRIEDIPKIKQGLDVIDQSGKLHKVEDLSDFNPSFSYAFCSDTAYFEDIIPEIENVDLLYHEATFTEDMRERAKKTFHSTAIDAANIAKKANVKRLLLGHVSARYTDTIQHEKEAKTIFKNSIGVEDGMEFLVE